MSEGGESQIGKGEDRFGRMLSRDLFLFLLDLEVKRARRYQNFLSILILKLVKNSYLEDGDGLMGCHKLLAGLLMEELRETDVLATLGEDKFAVILPYAHAAAGTLARSRFENLLKYYEFKRNGCDVISRQVSFPTNGTSTTDILKKALDESLSETDGL